MRCFKRLGERVLARSFKRQAVELHIRVALLIRFTQLVCPTTVAVALLRLGSGELRLKLDLRNKAIKFRNLAQKVSNCVQSLNLACRHLKM